MKPWRLSFGLSFSCSSMSGHKSHRPDSMKIKVQSYYNFLGAFYLQLWLGLLLCWDVLWRWQCVQKHALWHGGLRCSGHQVLRKYDASAYAKCIWLGNPSWTCVTWSNYHLILVLYMIIFQSKQFNLRLALWVIMNGDPRGFFCLIAVVCTSFSAINVGTSLRSACTPFGDTTKEYVRETELKDWKHFLVKPSDSVPSN